jgi:hypothetical protein
MNASEKEHFIRTAAWAAARAPQRILWSSHAAIRMARTNWTRDQVERSLREAVVIEDYPHQHRPLPDCLILASVGEDEPLHAVMAIDEPLDRIVVVTVYRPDPTRWKDDCRIRIR